VTRWYRVLVAVAVTGLVLGFALHRGSKDPTRSPSSEATSNAAAGGGSAAGSSTAGDPPASSAPDRSPVSALLPASSAGKGHLAPGSDPAVLPGPVLIADKYNNRLLIVDPHGRVRWKFPRPGDLRHGQTFKVPDDAFFTPDGRFIVATQEDDDVISLISVARHRIVWRYGVPGVPGSGPNHVRHPDDAMLGPDGQVVAADIENCRLIRIPVGGHHLVWSRGTPGSCVHAPPHRYGSPNGMFPIPHNRFLVTEINQDWVDEITGSGRVLWSVHPPSVFYPSDTNRARPGVYLTVDYSDPGQIVEFNRYGRTIWRYRPTGGKSLNKPSLALPLPNGDILANDDANHRVIVVNPRTDKILWQYGHRAVAGTAPGYLDNPDGVDLMPPWSYADRLIAGR
jgi:outer membrane protein assembly factor BamB